MVGHIVQTVLNVRFIEQSVINKMGLRNQLINTLEQRCFTLIAIVSQSLFDFLQRYIYCIYRNVNIISAFIFITMNLKLNHSNYPIKAFVNTIKIKYLSLSPFRSYKRDYNLQFGCISK